MIDSLIVTDLIGVILFAELASEKTGNLGQRRHKSRRGHKCRGRCDRRERANRVVFGWAGDFGGVEKVCQIRVVAFF